MRNSGYQIWLLGLSLAAAVLGAVVYATGMGHIAVPASEIVRIVAARNISKELGLIISPKRFSYLGTYSFAWARRRQYPEEHGIHDVSITMVLIVNEKEVLAIKPNEEYKEVKWRNPGLVAKDLKLFQAMRQYAKDVLNFLNRR